jgi:hypothetical protein
MAGCERGCGVAYGGVHHGGNTQISPAHFDEVVDDVIPTDQVAEAAQLTGRPQRPQPLDHGHQCPRITTASNETAPHEAERDRRRPPVSLAGRCGAQAPRTRGGQLGTSVSSANLGTPASSRGVAKSTPSASAVAAAATTRQCFGRQPACAKRVKGRMTARIAPRQRPHHGRPHVHAVRRSSGLAGGRRSVATFCARAARP